MTIKEFYEMLPESTSPKSDIIRKVVRLTGKTEQTVRLWFWGKTKPADDGDIKVLAELTGLSEMEMFENEK